MTRANNRKVTEAVTTIVAIVLARRNVRAETKAAIVEEQLAGFSLKPLEQAPLLLGEANVLVARIARYTTQALTHGLSVDLTLLMSRHRPVLHNTKRHIRLPGHPTNVRLNLVVLAVLTVLALHERIRIIIIIIVTDVRIKTILRTRLIS